MNIIDREIDYCQELQLSRSRHHFIRLRQKLFASDFLLNFFQDFTLAVLPLLWLLFLHCIQCFSIVLLFLFEDSLPLQIFFSQQDTKSRFPSKVSNKSQSYREI